MGFQGSLESVNLGDIFQTISMNRQTGTLLVRSGNYERFIWFDSGELAICNGMAKDGRPLILDILERRGLLQQKIRADLEARAYDTGQPVRDLILAANAVSLSELDDVASWCLEENVCEIFEWTEGSFEFIDGPPTPELDTIEIIETGEIRLQTSHVVMEAMRRVDEWDQIRTVIPNPDELFVVDNDGRANLRNIESDQDVLKVLRYLDGRHALDQIAEHVGLPRFDTYAIVANLIINNVTRPRSPQEILDDALTLRDEGEKEQARDLLETALARVDLPEVLRPLAEISLELEDAPRAVELFLDLVQRSQDDGDFDQSLADIETVIGINPDDPDLQLDKAEILIELGRTADASAAFINAAKNYLANREIKQAIDACHRAKDLAPTAPDPHRMLAQAYLLDSQSENALVEYKSLWHALLSHHRPKRALDELREILESDCKFPRITDQVLQHAGGSDAVKTGAAVRRLIYLLMLITAIGAGIYGWDYWQTQIKAKLVRQQISVIEGELNSDARDLDFKKLIQDVTKQLEVSTNPDTLADLHKLQTSVRTRYDERATQLADDIAGDLGNEMLNTDDLPDVKDKLARLASQYSDTGAYRTRHDDLDKEYRRKRAYLEIQKPREIIERMYDNFHWEEAIAKLTVHAERTDLPLDIQAELKQQLLKWQTNLTSAEFLFKQAQRLDVADQDQKAMEIFRRATTAKGEHYKAEARKELVNLELRTMEDIKRRIGDATRQNDTEQTFGLLAELRKLAENPLSTDVKRGLESVTLPFVVAVDHHRTTITVIANPSGEKKTYEAPEGTSGTWKLRLQYVATETLSVHGARAGFTSAKLTVTAEDKRLEGELVLTRGPLWQQPLPQNSSAITALINYDELLLCGTDNNSLVLIDSGQGTHKAISFGDGIATMQAPPFIYRHTAYISTAGQLHALDINTRRKLWSFPASDGIDTPSLGRAGVWVQENQLITGQLILFTGTQENDALRRPKIISLAIEDNTVTALPDTELPEAVTAAPLVLDSILYVPISNALKVYDATSIDKRQPLSEIYTYKTRGDIRHRPVLTTVFGRKALMLTDSAGAVIAIDADPAVDKNERSLGSWPIDDAPSGPPTADITNGVAYISLGEQGIIFALNIADKNKEPISWRFPPDGRIGTVLGSPAIGKNGIYIVDDIGMLYAIGDDGKERWKVDLGSGASTPVFARNGRLYVGTRSGDMLCFEEGED